MTFRTVPFVLSVLLGVLALAAFLFLANGVWLALAAAAAATLTHSLRPRKANA